MRSSLLFLLSLLVGPMLAQTPLPLAAGPGASLPRFTTDERGQPLLSWVEKRGESADLCFSRSADGGATFGSVQRLVLPAGTSTHAEGRPKLAVQADGTLVAAFEVARPTDDAPRAGDFRYTRSTDGGRTWSAARFVHRDTTAGVGHSFGDLARLPDGTVGAVWLDEKLPGREGRTVKFARLGVDGRFGPDVLVDSSACQCCRTALTAAPDGTVYLAYRDLLSDGSRDIACAVSTDGGRHFTTPQPVRADGWRVNACPHSGPQVVATASETFVTWFSGKEGEAGVRLAKVGQPAWVQAPLGRTTKAPQLAALADGRLVLCWEEWVGAGPDSQRKIGLAVFDEHRRATVSYPSAEGERAAQPTLLAADRGLLLAYVRTGEDEPRLVLHRFELTPASLSHPAQANR
jgi:hypothetical protein